ncbi:MAG: 2-amino-4-hydroxy-6-hydroxymethyldihydropteridine diphosphokinase [Acidimicrobiia bacterium]|nr:2-amino-4-hydroxy-6-hydroxymethyldihydropteridine diphosphokinase [Acidimicrobiia bacterium]
MIRAYLGIGSNLGDRHAELQRAVDRLGQSDGVVVHAVSPVYETDPVGGPAQDDFLNAVVAVETTLSPHQLLAVCAGVEQVAQRVRAVRWGPRTLDVDVLLVDGVAIDDPELTIPHPRMAERGFVLAPLHDLAPEVVDRPASGWPGVRRTDLVLMVPSP